jgi:hypothetical protein
MMPRILERLLPNAPVEYDQQQFNQILRQIEDALVKPYENENAAEEREAIMFFLGE